MPESIAKKEGKKKSLNKEKKYQILLEKYAICILSWLRNGWDSLVIGYEIQTEKKRPYELCYLIYYMCMCLFW